MLILFIIIGVGVALDLISKALTMGMGDTVIIKGVLNFIYAENTGASKGIFADIPGAVYWLAGFTIVALVLFGIFYFKNKTLQKSKFFNVAAGLFVAGAIGNMIDRLFLGFVRDFISIEFLHFFPFNTVFNMADIFVSFGVVLLLIYVIFIYEKDKSKYASR